MDSFLHFFFHHLDRIIQVLFTTLFILIALLLYRSFKSPEDSETSSPSKLKSVEDLLQKMIGQLSLGKTTDVAAGAPSAEGGAPAVSAAAAAAPELTAQVETLAKAIEEKEAKIKELEGKVAQSATAGAAEAPAQAPAAVDPKLTEQLQQLQIKIKELEAKLSEYEIIGEDIANLSIYKEENSRLKDQLEKLKQGSPAPQVTEVAPPAPAAPSKTVEAQRDLMQEFAQAVTEQKQVTQSIGASTVVSSEEKQELDRKQKALEEIATAAPTPVAVAAPAAPLPVAPTPAPQAKASAEAPVAEPPPPLAGSLDTNKLLTEMEEFNKSQPPPPKEGDEGSLLIEEFENFMKSS